MCHRLREPILEPDGLIVQDPTLFKATDVFQGLKPAGYLLVNTGKSFEELHIRKEAARLPHGHARVPPASEIALKHIGRPFSNAALRSPVAFICIRSRPRSGRRFPASSAKPMWPRPPRPMMLSVPRLLQRESKGMLKQIEGSRATAEGIALCRPEVICAYPITPQTHIVEGLGEMVRTEHLKYCEFINVESEFAALSVAIGASAAGARAYTATSSQRSAHRSTSGTIIPTQCRCVMKLGPGKRFKFSYDFCKGCGLCAQECPCGAIMMVPEAI